MLYTLASFLTGVDAATFVDELVDDVVDKVGERGVAKGKVGGVADIELLLWMGVATLEALTADAAAAKAAAAKAGDLPATEDGTPGATSDGRHAILHGFSVGQKCSAQNWCSGQLEICAQ